jgi:hypothetical protein
MNAAARYEQRHSLRYPRRSKRSESGIQALSSWEKPERSA